MGYWAKLDNNRIVIEVIIATEEEILTGQWGNPQSFVETSMTGEFRYNYAGIGYTYDLMANAFIPPHPNCSTATLTTSSYTWNTTSCFPVSGSL